MNVRSVVYDHVQFAAVEGGRSSVGETVSEESRTVPGAQSLGRRNQLPIHRAEERKNRYQRQYPGMYVIGE